VTARAEVGGRVRLTPRAAVLAAIVLVLATATVVPLRQYFAQQSQVDALERRLDTLQEERDRLQREIERLRDPEYLERLARVCLGMVRPGEIAFVTVPKGGERSPDPC
jgi:cell division protein FtsL